MLLEVVCLLRPKKQTKYNVKGQNNQSSLAYIVLGINILNVLRLAEKCTTVVG